MRSKGEGRGAKTKGWIKKKRPKKERGKHRKGRPYVLESGDHFSHSPAVRGKHLRGWGSTTLTKKKKESKERSKGERKNQTAGGSAPGEKVGGLSETYDLDYAH